MAHDVKFDLPKHLSDKAVQFSESSYGANLVTLLLRDGRRIKHVSLAAGRNVIRAQEASDEILLSRLRPEDIIDVVSEV